MLYGNLSLQENYPSNSCFVDSSSKIYSSSCSVWVLSLFQEKESVSLCPLSSSLFTSSFFLLYLLLSFLIFLWVSRSVSSLAPYLLIFLCHTVVISAAMLSYPWHHWSMHFQSHLPPVESEIYFSSSSMCAAHFCSVWPPLSYFSLARFPVKIQPFLQHWKLDHFAKK